MPEFEKIENFRWPLVRSEWHEVEVDSTNDWSRRLIESGDVLDLPALVWADRQIRGRGQGANAWYSDDASLTASIIIDPEAYGLAVSVRPRVALAVAAAVVAAVAEVAAGCHAGIRWPNDVEVAGRKLGGILVEGVTSPAGPRLIIGVGVNVGTRLDRAPVEVRHLAASLAEFGLDAGSRRTLLAAILARLTATFQDLATAAADLVDEWNRLDTLVGSTIRVQVGTERFTAVAEGIDPTGGLRIKREGKGEVLFAGRILRD